MTTMSTILRISLSVMIVLGAAARLANGSTSVVDVDVPDAELVDQDNHRVRFVSEVIGDRLAAVTFTFTNCTTICPVLDGIFLGVQSKIADDLGRDSILVSVTVDPTNDIPERLKAHAGRLDADPAWRFLTGDKDTVNSLLKALEVYAPNILDHPPTVFVVDGSRGVWTRLNGFPSPDKIAQILDQYRSARRGR